jgi:hypothetical protein
MTLVNDDKVEKVGRELLVRRLQCDEIWCFVGAKAKNVTPEKEGRRMGRYVDVDRAGC